MEKSVHFEDRTVTLSDRALRTVHLYALGGAIGLGDLNDKGELEFVELRRIRTSRKEDATGLFRWYNDYELPEAYEGRTVTVRLYNNDEYKAPKLNRTENVRPIPPSDPDFKWIYGRRSDSESNQPRLGRHAVPGPGAQHRARPPAVELLGYALVVNSVALHEHRQRRKRAAAA